MSGLTLLASYPKSGNTWMRAFFASLRRSGRTPDINVDLIETMALASRVLHDKLGDIDSADLTMPEMFRLRPFVSRRVARELPGIYKVHDCNIVPAGASEPAIPADAIDRVIYIVRDPRDVAVSAAHHFGRSIDQIVEEMEDSAHALGKSDSRLQSLVGQYVGDWSRHVTGWIDAIGVSVRLVRYEDMQRQPDQEFGGVCRFLGWDAKADDIGRAIEATRFDRLAEQERLAGFVERLPKSNRPFFREGRMGGWRETLSPALTDRIVDRHGAVMRRLGYL